MKPFSARFKHISNYTVLLALVPLCLYGLLRLSQKDTQQISFKDGTLAIGTFSDATEGGHSESESYTSSSIRFSTTLREGTAFPYAGIALYHTQPTFFALADTKWEMTITVEENKCIPITLVIPQQRVSAKTDTLLLQTNVYTQRGTHIYQLSVSEFKQPEWWLIKYRQKPMDLSSIDLNKVTSICFLSDQNQQLDQKNTVEITDFEIRPDLWPLQQAFLIGAAPYYLLLLLVPLYKRRKERVLYVPIYPQENKVPQEPLEKIKHVMASQFHIADLTVEMVASASGVPAYKIPLLLQEHMGLNFKKLLNMIRLEEAKRLLQDPHLRISEIAYRVGYQHVQHFNRIFKEATSQTPKEFREYFLETASATTHKH